MPPPIDEKADEKSTVQVKETVKLPPNASSLTAHPSEDLSKATWCTLHSIPVTEPSSAFWHTIHSFTHIDHWNRTLYALDLVSELYTPSPDLSAHKHEERLTHGSRYTALRNFRRKTPSPIGDTTPCYTATEWTSQFIQHDTENRHTHHVAIFSFIIPESVVTPDNPRALRYWPFQYPKVRAYRFTYIQTSNETSQISYDVLPLHNHHPSEYPALLRHSRPGATKILTTLRKRMRSYDPLTGLSTYEKRVFHDRLVSEADYRDRYDSMKQKYSFWVKQWNECTDPQKFVFEEMAIAAYLCALWETERRLENIQKPQSFIDMGCGNGFLVYLLISEGHPGIGIDIRRRGIWDEYPPEVRESLCEQTIDPKEFIVSSYDWVLGNHSDELSPWIPLITARSQLEIAKRSVCEPVATLADKPVRTLRRAYPRFFVLPCCFFDFDGRKVSFGRTRRTLGVRTAHGMGKYEQYYRWIAQIGRAFGFTTEFENLRIPSTKYVSVFGRFVEFEERVQPHVIEEMISLLMLDARLSR